PPAARPPGRRQIRYGSPKQRWDDRRRSEHAWHRSPSCFSFVAASRQAAPAPARGRSCNTSEIAVRFNLIVGFSTVNRSSRPGADCDAIGANLMWQKLSLRGRINLLLALGLTLG